MARIHVIRSRTEPRPHHDVGARSANQPHLSSIPRYIEPLYLVAVERRTLVDGLVEHRGFPADRSDDRKIDRGQAAGSCPTGKRDYEREPNEQRNHNSRCNDLGLLGFREAIEALHAYLLPSSSPRRRSRCSAASMMFATQR